MDLERLMYSTMMSLNRMNAPIVFKGALVLKAIQHKYGNPSGLERETHDIDGDWVGNPPSMNYLRDLVQKAVINAGYDNIEIRIKREYSETRSAGFDFIDSNSKVIVSMDLSIRPNTDVECYFMINGFSFYGQSISKVLVDKIISVSQRVIMRRIKDVIDLYILSFIWRGNTEQVYSHIKKLSKELGDFSCFTTRVDELGHAYSKYNNKASILPFNQVYRRVFAFLEPFIKVVHNAQWNGERWFKVD